MSQPAAFVGQLVELRLGAPRDPMVAHVALPRGEFDDLIRGIGLPHLHPSAALIACERPTYPASHHDVLALACARELARLLDTAEVRVTAEVVRELDTLAAAVNRAVDRWEREVRPEPQPEVP